MPDHPNPPWRVLATVDAPNYLVLHPVWCVCDGYRWWIGLSGFWCAAQFLTPIADPHNDPEAVEIIKKAKGEN